MGWVSPTGFSDPENKWDNEPVAYDGVLTNSCSESAPAVIGHYVIFTLGSAIDCDKVRYYAHASFPIENISIAVYYSGGWHTIFSGALSAGAWHEKAIGSTQSVDQIRITQNTTASRVFIAELDFWEVEFVTHELTVTDAIALTDTLVKTPMKMISDGIALTDVLIKNPIKTLVDSIKFTDVVEKVYLYVRTFTDGIAITDVLIKSTAKVLSDGIAFTDTLWKVWTHGVLRILTAVRNLLSVREDGTKR